MGNVPLRPDGTKLPTIWDLKQFYRPHTVSFTPCPSEVAQVSDWIWELQGRITQNHSQGAAVAWKVLYKGNSTELASNKTTVIPMEGESLKGTFNALRLNFRQPHMKAGPLRQRGQELGGVKDFIVIDTKVHTKEGHSSGLEGLPAAGDLSSARLSETQTERREGEEGGTGGEGEKVRDRRSLICLEGFDVIGKRDVLNSIRGELTALWDKAIHERPVLGLLWGIVTGATEAIEAHSSKAGEMQKQALLQCKSEWTACSDSLTSFRCISSVYHATTTCAELLKKTVSHEIEMPAWMNLETIQESATGFLATTLVFVQTFISILWSIFMWLLDVWVFFIVLWLLVSSEVSVSAWVFKDPNSNPNPNGRSLSLPGSLRTSPLWTAVASRTSPSPAPRRYTASSPLFLKSSSSTEYFQVYHSTSLSSLTLPNPNPNWRSITLRL